MKQSLRLGKVAGLPVEVHWTVAVVLAIIVYLVGTVALPTALPHQTAVSHWSGAAVAALVFLGSLLVHELAHALVARRHGMRVYSVTLWLLGGMTELDTEPRDAAVGLRIALAGPAASLAEATVFVTAAVAASHSGAPAVATAAAWLAVMNAVIAVFNMLPGAPLDGGRILRALLSRHYQDSVRASVTAAKAGRYLGLLIAAAGTTGLLLSPSLDGIWLVLIGWFLASAAMTEERVAEAMAALSGMRVADVMTPEPRVAAGQTTVREFVRQAPAYPRQSAFPVLTDGELAGVVTIGQLGLMRRTARAGLRLDQVAIEVPRRYLAAPEDPAAPLLARPLLGGEVAAVVVVDGHITGLVTWTGLSAAVWRAVGAALPRRRYGGDPAAPGYAESARRMTRPVPGRGLSRDDGHANSGRWSLTGQEQGLWGDTGACGRLTDMATNIAGHDTAGSGLSRHEQPEPGIHTGYRDELRRAEHACCCSASPTVIAVLPPSPDRAHHTGLTFCAHHYRASGGRLAAAGAAIYDRDGRPVTTEPAAFVLL